MITVSACVTDWPRSLLVCLILVAAGLALQAQTSEPFAIRWKGAGVSLSGFAWSAMYLAFAITGMLLVTRSASQVVGWLCLAIGLIQSVSFFVARYAAYALFQLEGRLPGGEWAAWVGSLTFGPTFGALGLLLLVFPDDRFASPRWQVVAYICSAAIAAQTLAIAVKPGPTTYSMPEGSLANPAGMEWLRGITEPVTQAAGVAAMLLLVGGLVSLVMRYRRSTTTRRAQIRYVAVAGCTLMLVFVVTLLVIAFGSAREGGENPLLGEVSGTLFAVGLAGLPLAIGIAILRPRATG